MVKSELFEKKIFEICSIVRAEIGRAQEEQKIFDVNLLYRCSYVIAQQKELMLKRLLAMLIEIAPEDVRDFFLHYDETVQRFNAAIDSYERGEKNGVHA